MDDLGKNLLSQVSGGKTLLQNKVVWRSPIQATRPTDKGFTQPVPFPVFTR